MEKWDRVDQRPWCLSSRSLTLPQPARTRAGEGAIIRAMWADSPARQTDGATMPGGARSSSALETRCVVPVGAQWFAVHGEPLDNRG